MEGEGAKATEEAEAAEAAEEDIAEGEEDVEGAKTSGDPTAGEVKIRKPLTLEILGLILNTNFRFLKHRQSSDAVIDVFVTDL